MSSNMKVSDDMFRHYDETKFLVSMYILTISLFNFMTGIFFITADPRISSPTYTKMQELMPLSVYGLIMLTSAILLFSCIFQHGKIRNIFMLFGVILGAVSIGLYASASSIGAVNLMLPSRYSLISISCLLISIAGGFSLWRMRTNM